MTHEFSGRVPEDGRHPKFQLIFARYRHSHATIRVTQRGVMTMNSKHAYTATITALCLAGFGAAYAANTDENDALGITDARISLTQAISTAEQHVGGKASSAEYEHEDGRWIFEVEVVKGRDVMDVEVDPTSGEVLSVVNDKVDEGNEAEREAGERAND